MVDSNLERIDLLLPISVSSSELISGAVYLSLWLTVRQFLMIFCMIGGIEVNSSSM
mgnify:CR=1 FL=1